MSVPAEIRSVTRPVNTIVVDRGGNGINRYAVIERIGCKRINGMNQPVSGETIGHIINGEYVPVDNISALSISNVELKGYADSVLINNLSSSLLEELLHFYTLKDAWTIYVLALLKVIYPNEPYKRLGLRYEKSFLSELYPGLSLSKNTICTFLNNLGSSYSRIVSFMRSRVENIAKGQNIIIDGTLKNDNSYVNSFSHFSRKAKTKGTKDITVLFAYDGDNLEPLCSKVYGGNVIDSISFENFLSEMRIENGIILADKGFPRSKAEKAFSSHPNLHYLLPIKRDDVRIDKYKLYDYDSMLTDDKNKDLLAKKVKVEGKVPYFLYSFYDRGKAAKEEKDYFKNNKGKEFSKEELDKKDKTFGTIVFESDVDKEEDEIYRLYDERWLIEDMFRYYKDEDEFKETRVHDDSSVIGSEFISFFSAVMTSRLFKKFDEKGLFKENSYKDIMCDLRQAKKVKIDDKWLYVQLPLGIQEELRELGLLPTENATPKEKKKRGRPKKIVTELKQKRKPGRPRKAELNQQE